MWDKFYKVPNALVAAIQCISPYGIELHERASTPYYRFCVAHSYGFVSCRFCLDAKISFQASHVCMFIRESIRLYFIARMNLVIQ